MTDTRTPRKAVEVSRRATARSEQRGSGPTPSQQRSNSLIARLATLLKWGSTERAAHLRVGDRAESLAAKMLRGKRYRVLARNVRTNGGEADLVMLAPDRRTVVLVEVKGRNHSSVGAAVAINAQKRARLVRTMDALRKENGWADRPCRIDVVTVEWPDAGMPPVIRHYENAVGARG